MPTTAKKRTAVPEGEFDAAAAASSAQSVVDVLTDDAKTQAVQMVAPSAIHPHPDNPRKDLGDLTELMDSIRSNGVLQPIRVIPHPDRAGEFMALLGHRRRAASIEAGLPWVPVVVSHGMDRATQIEAMLVENIQRSDLTVIEEGAGYQDLLDLGVTRSTIAKHTGRAGSTVTQRVKIASLPESFHAAVVEHQVTLEEAAGFADLPEQDEETFAAAIKALDKGKDAPSVLRAALSKAKTRELMSRAEKLAGEFGFRVTMKNSWDISPKASLHDLDWDAAEHQASECDGGLLCTSSWSLGSATLAGLGQLICTKPEKHEERLEEVRAERRANAETRQQQVESDEERERREIREQLLQEINAATAARRAWVTGLFLPSAEHVGPMRTAVQEYATALIGTGRFTVDVNVWSDSIVADVLADSVKGPDRLATLAILSCAEGSMPSDVWRWNRVASDDQYMRGEQTDVGNYLAALRDAGYELSAIETQLLEAVDAHLNGDDEDGAA